jgi:hypothetical protein
LVETLSFNRVSFGREDCVIKKNISYKGLKKQYGYSSEVKTIKIDYKLKMSALFRNRLTLLF